MKNSVKLMLAALVILAVAIGIGIAMKRQTGAPGGAAGGVLAKPEPIIELDARDLYTIEPVVLSQGLALSGSLKAAVSAVVKAKVSGELQRLTLREGDPVKAGQLVAQVDSSEYLARERQAKQNAQAAIAQVDIAQRSYDNNKALVDQGFISKTALETSWANLRAAQASHQAALAALDVARKSVSDAALLAPISGIVSQRLAQPGERVGIDARVLEIVDLSRLELEAALAPADALQVRIGQTARLRVEGQNEDIAATVVRINPSVSTGSRSVIVYLRLNAQPGLRQGLFVEGILNTGEQTALAAPLSAVRTDKPQPYVQTVQAGRIKHQSVELGTRGQAQGQTMVALKNIASGTIITGFGSGSLGDNTAVSLPAKSGAAQGAETATTGVKGK